MKQIIISGTGVQTPSPSSTEYNGVNVGAIWGTEWHNQCIPIAGTFSFFRVKIGAPPGGPNKSWTFTLRVNGADTALTVTIQGATATSGNDMAHTVNVVAGDLVTLKSVPSASPQDPDACSTISWTLQFENDGCIQIGQSLTVSNKNTRYWGVTDCALLQNANESLALGMCPTSGSLRNFYVKLTSAFSQGATTFTLRKKGVDTSLAVTITAPDSSGSNTTDIVSVAAGDYLTISVYHDAVMVPIQTRNTAYGMTFLPVIDGESIIMGNADDVNASAVSYALLNNMDGAINVWSADERTQQAHSVVLKQFYVALGTSPGAGNSYTFTLRQNNADTAMSFTIQGDAASGSDTTHELPLAMDDRVNLKCTPTGTPPSDLVYWGIVCEIGLEPLTGDEIIQII